MKRIGSSAIENGFPCFSAFQTYHGFTHAKSRTVEAALRAPCFTTVFPAARMRRMARSVAYGDGVVALRDLRLHGHASAGTCMSYIYIYTVCIHDITYIHLSTVFVYMSGCVCICLYIRTLALCHGGRMNYRLKCK